VRWPLLPVVLTSGHPLEHIRELPPGVAYMPKPWQPLNVLVAAERALASAREAANYSAIERLFRKQRVGWPRR
jgi:hypothetical protein